MKVELEVLIFKRCKICICCFGEAVKKNVVKRHDALLTAQEISTVKSVWVAQIVLDYSPAPRAMATDSASEWKSLFLDADGRTNGITALVDCLCPTVWIRGHLKTAVLRLSGHFVDLKPSPEVDLFLLKFVWVGVLQHYFEILDWFKRDLSVFGLLGAKNPCWGAKNRLKRVFGVFKVVFELDLWFWFSRFLEMCRVCFFCFLIRSENGGDFGVFLGCFCPKKGGALYSVHTMRLSAEIVFLMNRFWWEPVAGCFLLFFLSRILHLRWWCGL